MKVERGDLFVKRSTYSGTSVCVCVGVRDSTVHYILLGQLNGLRDLTNWTEEHLCLNYSKSSVHNARMGVVEFKIPYEFLNKVGQQSYNHIKQKFLDTNIL